jgi:DNA mismatch repair protein MutS
MTGCPRFAATPVRRQYLQIKRRFPDTILLFRLGDFYETFEQDAERAARVLDIVLTSREMGKGVRVPMAGIPHHAADGYIARLVAAGSQGGDLRADRRPGPRRPLIDRDVRASLLPGTVTDPAMLDSRRNSFIAALSLEGGRAGSRCRSLHRGVRGDRVGRKIAGGDPSRRKCELARLV